MQVVAVRDWRKDILDDFAATFSGNVYSADKAAMVDIADGSAFLRITMPRGAAIRGTVLGFDGKPLGGTLVYPEVGRTGVGVTGSESTWSNRRGRYYLRGLPPVEIAPRVMWGDAPIVPTYAPSTEFARQAAVVKLTEGMTSEAPPIRVRRGATVTGRVTDATGAPVSDAYVYFRQGHPYRDRVPDAFTDRDGRYVVEALPEGPYTPWVTSEGHPPVWSGNGFSPVSATVHQIPTGGVTRRQDFVVSGQSAQLMVVGYEEASDCDSGVTIYDALGGIVGFGTWNGSTILFASDPIAVGRPVRLGAESNDDWIGLDNDPMPVVFHDRALSLADATPITVAVPGSTKRVVMHAPDPSPC